MLGTSITPQIDRARCSSQDSTAKCSNARQLADTSPQSVSLSLSAKPHLFSITGCSDVQTSVGISYRHLGTLSAFTADLNFSGAAAALTVTAPTASRTIRFVTEYDDSVGDMLSQSFAFPVTN